MTRPTPHPDRRRLLQAGALVLLMGAPHLAHAGRVVAVRIWPAQDYTRVTIESDGELKAQKTTVDQAHRLVVEIEGIDLIEGMRELVGKLSVKKALPAANEAVEPSIYEEASSDVEESAGAK